LTTEIDRVAQTTKFNETYLLKGDSSLNKSWSINYMTATAATASASMQGSANGGSVSVSFAGPSASLDNATANELVKSLRDQGVTMTTSGADGTAGGGSATIQLNGDAATDFNVVTSADGSFFVKDSEGNVIAQMWATSDKIDGTSTMLAAADGYQAQRSDTEIATFYDADGNAVSANALTNYFAANDDGTVTKRAEAGALYDAVGYKLDDSDIANELQGVQDITSALNIKFQVGADTSSGNKISVNIDAMSAKGLGINGLKVDGKDSTNADSAVNTISEAIQKVSKQRSTLGAVQNRLEHTINNLDNVVENTTSAESAIRDTDMATEMVTYSNANILSQAGQAMLAQSNQSNQGVLSLLG
jgi:flagellin